MGPILTASVAATQRDIITLDDLKGRLGITTGTNDDELQRVIRARSGAIFGWCGLAADQHGKRTFSRETLVATWLIDYGRCSSNLILPWRVPVTSITSIVEDGTTLTADQYQVSPMAALIRRVEDDAPCYWSTGKIVVTYVAGFLPPDDDDTDMPAELQDACIQECSSRWLSKGRDPALRSENVPEVHAYTVGYGQDGARADLLPETETMLAAAGYRNPGIG